MQLYEILQEPIVGVPNTFVQYLDSTTHPIGPAKIIGKADVFHQSDKEKLACHNMIAF